MKRTISKAIAIISLIILLCCCPFVIAISVIDCILSHIMRRWAEETIKMLD